MELINYIIVGGGPAAAAAAFALKGQDVLMLDVGALPDKGLDCDSNIYELRKNNEDLDNFLIGDKFEALNNVTNTYINPKIKSPPNRYIIDGRNSLCPRVEENFDTFVSFAKGGMANGWGAGAYRFREFDFRTYPISYDDLHEDYNVLTDHVGINGTEDDLTPYLGTANGLQPLQEIPLIAHKIYRQYKRKKKCFNGAGISIGHLRQAVLTKPHNGRRETDYSNLEFFRPYLPYIYNPAFTINELVESNDLKYVDRVLVISYEELEGHYKVIAKNVDTNERVEFYCKNLLIGAGAINTSKIVLKANNDTETKLLLQENPITYIPFLFPRMIGAEVEKSCVPAFFGAMIEDETLEEPVWASMYGLSGPLKSEYLFDFPLSARANVAAAKYLSPAMIIAQLFYPGVKSEKNYLKLEEDDSLKISFESYNLGEMEKKVIKHFRKLGLYGHPSLCKCPPPGNSFHYACTLPMKENPEGSYETDKNGKLNNTRSVYILDSANFTNLPAMNLTFTIMAMSHRIARLLVRK